MAKKRGQGLSSKKVIPPYIFCVRCASKVEIIEDNDPNTKKVMDEHGYIAMGKGICECGIIYVLCVQPMPRSPTFSLFFDIYQPTPELAKARKTLIMKKA